MCYLNFDVISLKKTGFTNNCLEAIYFKNLILHGKIFYSVGRYLKFPNLEQKIKSVFPKTTSHKISNNSKAI